MHISNINKGLTPVAEEKYELNRDLGQLVKNLYNALKTNLCILDDNENRNSVKNDDGSLFSDLEDNYYTQTNIEEEDEISCYIKSQDIRIKDDPLIWWSNYRDSFLTLVQLARKYLSILMTSVPSEQLFSDAKNHISAKKHDWHLT
ncbi:zinc finger BED domain-containing protein 1-like [Rhizophagus clarus]|uniref:Zinc finger BED domain-containing protein 1-like n=1 Tax=Rhizophagus clarus TaxID=94130 RepID=A0A8H3M3Z9_9GLOM|nr:zinc finger BED domain-containing protein 1-like [Rhizophagus clarus]